MDSLTNVIDRAGKVQNGEAIEPRTKKFNSYAVSNFRGGIGKSTLSFNLAYEMSAEDPTLVLDLCPQRNMTQSLLGEDLSVFETTIYDALLSEITNTGEIDLEELVLRVTSGNNAFLGSNRKKSYIIPGSQELFLFPSLLYSQLAQYQQLGGTRGKAPSAKVLNAISNIIDIAKEKTKAKKILMDTSPFFGGATHLSWCAAEALIIPVRVDQHSIEALRLTLDMLANEDSEFHKFNRQAGLNNIPKVHAVTMTHCGWSRQNKNNPDSSTKYFLQRALEIAKEYEHLFSENECEKCFYLLDDFLSSGRISGKQRIPLSKLSAGKKFTVDGQRLEVNPSIERYKKEMKNLAFSL
ncbi:ParA family protein [Klebsiella aerogenes]|uniref:ParA family protein n=1 Tax=Klebsiella aerogenes TaxID=548 RepID=UPI0015CAE837|nr:ParA family protein [Klebsiella aerogenes]EKZ9889225.1 ParA family protein [Klebsiella aerogenes]EMA4693180.1 ParA family protein [Klebsiella aerogenes]MCG6822632.1 ParA family protein [Klebsiella aerogenes]MEB6107652.1 ParA family protein [Klebsiella aerogenes]WHB04779.1 ParA family protein [Klebsiella aerogenes]